MDAFTGWPAGASALLADIAADNRADRWPELREGHAALVRGPTLALAASLEAEFGPVRVFRAHATRRFRPDAPPLRTDTGGVATSAGGCGMAVVLSVDAFTVTVGHWRFDRDQRSRYRAAVDDVETGEALAGLLRRLAAAGLPADPEGELSILPRGWKPDHPRVWLARRRGLQVVRRWELGPWVATPEPLERVRSAWRAAAPLAEWLDVHVGPASPRPTPPRPTRAASGDPTAPPAADAAGPATPSAAAAGDPVATATAAPGGSAATTSAARAAVDAAGPATPSAAASGDPVATVAAAPRGPAARPSAAVGP